MKKLIVFDLDGTLAESKASLEREMSALIGELLGIVKVAVISGGNWPQFEKQVLAKLPHDERLKNLSLLPTCGTKFYRYDSGWKLLYSEDFTAGEKQKIIYSLKHVMETSGFAVPQTWGDIIEDRGSQITFSALGQQAPLAEKQQWDADFAKRQRMKAQLDQLIPEFSIRLGGTTSIDVTKPGRDKAFGIRKLRDTLGIAIEDMVFVGDALFPGGNDYPAKEAGVFSIQVRDPNESKRVIETIIACLAGAPRELPRLVQRMGRVLPRIYLIRHGETEWSLSGKHTGSKDLPLTAHGEEAARELGQRLRGVAFAKVLTSPRQRARRTCELTELSPAAQNEPDLAEWDYGEYEGQRTADIHKSRPNWNIFRDGCPQGESPTQVTERADRLIAHLRLLEGNIALFSHGHFGRVLTVRWIGLPVSEAQHFLLSTASLSILGYEHNLAEEPAIVLWNTGAEAIYDSVQNQRVGERRAIEQWENEGGEIPNEPRTKGRAAVPSTPMLEGR